MHINDIFSWCVDSPYLSGNLMPLSLRTCTQTHQSGQVEQKKVLYDERTGNLYTPDSPSTLVGKSIAILYGNPIHLAATLITNAALVPLHILGHLYSTLSHRDLSFAATEITKDLYDDIWRITRAPFYALAIEFAALKGLLLTPFDKRYAFEAKIILAEVEKNWNHGFDRSYDFRYYARHHDSSKVQAFFLAFCFQPIAHISHPNIHM